MNNSPLDFGCAGLGGYAGGVCDHLLEFSQRENPLIRLRAVCDPEPQQHPQRVAALKAAGVKVFDRYEQLLAEPIEALWLPLPIDLHRAFTVQALESGKHVICEKPAAGSVDDVDAMIGARDRSRKHVAIGFQDLTQPGYVKLKQKLVSGALGKPKSATLLACWPRGERYFSRNAWAGKLARNGTWILDSPASNAMAHFIHLTMYLMSPDLAGAAAPIAVQAELYRANPIENFDTCCLRLTLDGGMEFLVALTHCCDSQIGPNIQINTDRATIRMNLGKPISIESGGATETIDREGDRYWNIINAFVGRLRGDLSVASGATLETARAHVLAVNGASEAALIHAIPESEIRMGTFKEDPHVRVAKGLPEAFESCVKEQKMLHELGAMNWSKPPGGMSLEGYRHFRGPRQS